MAGRVVFSAGLATLLAAFIHHYAGTGWPLSFALGVGAVFGVVTLVAIVGDDFGE